MPSLKDFVSALQAGWFPALASLVGCSIIVLGDFFGVRYLNSSPEFLITAAVIVGIFSFSILVANIAYLPVVVWRVIRKRQAREAFKVIISQEIETAPYDERALLAYLVTSGRKAFVASFNDARLAPLVSKGFLLRLGGTHSVLEWPYVVREEVWDYLVEHREYYHADIQDNAPDPFNWRSRRW